MKNLLPLAVAICLCSCNPAANKAMNDSIVTSAQDAEAMIQMAIDHDFSDCESVYLKQEPERAKPVYARAVAAKEISWNMEKKLNDLKLKFLEGKSVDIKSEVGALFNEADETGSKILAILSDHQKARCKARFSSAKYKDQFTKENALLMLTLMWTDLKAAEYNAVDMILRDKYSDPI